MNIHVCYIAVTHGKQTAEFAARFVATWHEFPCGEECRTLILCNGGPLRSSRSLIFAGLKPKPSFFPRQNDPGWDVTAYIHAAKTVCAEADMMVCLGESAYFHRAGWLKRFREAWEKHGPGMYGAFSSNTIRGHLNTNGFAIAPKMLASWHDPLRNKKERYRFEHGENALWRRLEKFGYPVKLVTWDGEWGHDDWRKPQNIMWRGNQSNCLFWCNHVDRWNAAGVETKVRWSKYCDQPFK